MPLDWFFDFHQHYRVYRIDRRIVMPTSKLLKDVADYCWSNKFLGRSSARFYVFPSSSTDKYNGIDLFRQYFHDHAEEFEGAPSMCAGEHDLKYYSLFQAYLKLYEVKCSWALWSCKFDRLTSPLVFYRIHWKIILTRSGSLLVNSTKKCERPRPRRTTCT